MLCTVLVILILVFAGTDIDLFASANKVSLLVSAIVVLGLYYGALYLRRYLRRERATDQVDPLRTW